MNVVKSDIDLNESRETKTVSIIQILGVSSFLVGIFFWIYFAFWYFDNWLAGSTWNSLGLIVDENQGEQWVTVFLVMFFIPAITLFLGVIFGLIGLIGKPRKFAYAGLVLNIVPSLFLVWMTYHMFVPFE